MRRAAILWVASLGLGGIARSQPCSPEWDVALGTPGADELVTSLLATDDLGADMLFAGGWFGSIGGVSANHIAQCHDGVWTAMGSGIDGSNVDTLVVFDDGSGTALYVGGNFQKAGGKLASNIARWDGLAWSPLGYYGNGTNAGVLCLTAFDEDGQGPAAPALFLGGAFTSAGGEDVGYIARWDGQILSAVGEGLNGAVRDLCVWDDGNGTALYVVGDFTGGPGLSAAHIAKWDGMEWSSVGIGLDWHANALASFDFGSGDELVVGGDFTKAGGVPALRLARWNGANWAALAPFGDGVDGPVLALCGVSDAEGQSLYAGGYFVQTASGLLASRIVGWRNGEWFALGEGLDAGVEALTISPTDSRVVVGGNFQMAGGGSASHIAEWGCAEPDGSGRLWLQQFGTPGADAAFSLASDDAGGLFVSGTTTGELGGPNAGAEDAFVARYDGGGNRVWTRQLGTGFYDSGNSAARDGQGGVYLAGNTLGNLGGANAGSADIYLAKLTPDGDTDWVVQFGSNGDDEIGAAADDHAGGVFVTGFTGGSLGGPNQGGYDIFVARYGANGQQLWLKQFGSSLYDYALAVAPVDDGGAVIAGFTDGDLGPGNLGETDAFLARYDGEGNRLWIRQFGTDDYDHAFDLFAGNGDRLVIGGSTRGVFGADHAGGQDGFVAEFDLDGQLHGVRQFGTGANEYVQTLTGNATGALFLSGPASGDLYGPNAGREDVFLCRLPELGDENWATQIGTGESDLSYSLMDDGDGGFFVCGYTAGSLGAPVHGVGDAFLAHYRPIGCSADLTGDGTLDLFDFLTYVNEFNAGHDAAECDGDPGLTLFDFLCFVNAFNEGC